MTPIALTPYDLALAAALLIINGAISVAVGLRLERTLAIAAVRTVVQLAAAGFVLKFVLEQTSLAWTVLIGLIMVLVAGFACLSFFSPYPPNDSFVVPPDVPPSPEYWFGTTRLCVTTRGCSDPSWLLSVCTRAVASASAVPASL